MSTSTKKLNELIDEQQAILNTIKAEAQAMDNEDLSQQNERLKASLEEVSKSEAALKNENESLKKALSTTKAALFAKMANEKLLVFESTQKKLESIYYHESYAIGSRLDAYEANCKASLKSTINAIEHYGTNEFNDILQQMNALKFEAEQRRARIAAYQKSQMENAAQTNFAIGIQLRNEPVTEAEKRAALKQKSIESFIGLNVLGKAGIFLFIIGIIMLGRFAYVHMSDIFKGGIIYLLGAVLIVIGELFHKKEKTVFSTTLISGGVATLYAAATTCYFAFDLYNETITFILCIVITAIAIAISNQVKNEVVCGFAAVGGYLPVVALYMIGFGSAAANKSFLPVSSVYFCLLAIVLFIMTYNKKWHIAQFIGYGLHLIAIGGVAKCAYAVRILPGYSYALPLATAFAIASFVIYLMMPASKIIKRQQITTGDSVLLALNAISGAVSVSITVNNCITKEALASKIVGLVFLAFALIYALLMAFSIREKKQSVSIATIITSVSALVFSMLVTPLLFGMEYTGISWSIEGVIIAIIFINKKVKIPELAGLICMVLSVISTFANTTMPTSIRIVSFAVILCTFWIYTVKGIINSKDINAESLLYHVTEIITAYSTAGFIVYLYDCIMDSPSITISSNFAYTAVAIIAVLAVSVVIRFGILKNMASIIVSDIAGICLFFATLIALDIIPRYTDTMSYYGGEVEAKGFWAVNLVLLIAINIFVELFLARAVLDIINRLNAPTWIYTMTISVSALLVITATLMHHFDVEFSSVIISALYIVIACVLLFIGFKKRFTIVRSGGLILILCAFAKLCFVDTAHLDSGWKIASYFAFGAILIVISFFYQKFSKKLETDAVSIVDIESENNEITNYQTK